MAIKFVAVKCPQCGATLQVEDDRKILYCSYCGSQILIENENEYIYRTIDEAKVKQAEAYQNIQLKKLEIIERKRKDAARRKTIRLIVTVVMCAAGVILMITGDFFAICAGLMLLLFGLLSMIHGVDHKEEEKIDFGDEVKIKFPDSLLDYQDKKYTNVEDILSYTGFTNVKSEPLHDLLLFKKNAGMVDNITINGEDYSGGSKKYDPDIPIVIYYHSPQNG